MFYPAKHSQFDAISLAEILFTQLGFDSNKTFFVAYSGGVDSLALLHALSQVEPKLKLVALHVEHGLQSDSSIWAAHCKNTCTSLDVEYRSHNLIGLSEAAANSGIGLEAKAREMRYQWLCAQAQGGYLLTGHHQQDLAETLIFNLLRGSGSKGLSSLKASRAIFGVELMRPLLAFTKQDLENYANRHKLEWIEDPSNNDLQFSRNEIRHRIIPILNEYQPNAIQTIARAAANLADESQLLGEIAHDDLAELNPSRPHFIDGACSIDVSNLSQFSDCRVINVLRYWFSKVAAHRQLGRDTVYALLQSIRNAAEVSAQAILQEQAWQFRLYDNKLYCLRASAADAAKKGPSYTLNKANDKLTLTAGEVDIKFAIERPLSGAVLRELDCTLSEVQASFAVVCRPELNEYSQTHQLLDDQAKSFSKKAFYQQKRVPQWRRDIQPVLISVLEDKVVVLDVIDPTLKTKYLTFKA